MVQPATPLPASTVVLVRPDQAGGFEIFLNRRPHNMDVYAGIYVFPGGRVEKSDCAPEMMRLTQGLTLSEAQQKLGGSLTAELCVGHWVAAVRELFEEAGIHFFVQQNGGPDEVENLTDRLARHRVGLQEGSVDFASMLVAERLCCDLGRLIYFFHRVTPEHNPVRFDTRFYIAALPPQQSPLPSSEEVSESLWISASEALARSQSGKLPMMPPTVAVLRNLSNHRSWDELCQTFQLC